MAYSELYSEVSVIGRGNFGIVYSGTVYLVHSKKNRQPYVAKKILLAGLSSDQVEAANKEVTVLKKLVHPHVVSYIESFIEPDYLIIVMEHCDSGDLSSLISSTRSNGQQISEDTILAVLLQSAEALDYIHASRILHRDIKSSNIFLTADGDVKLGDFGIARVLEHSTSLAMTTVGTPYYMSPEVCESLPYNSKSDVWSLGIVAYELCALGYPFVSESLLGLIVKISGDVPAPLPVSYSRELRDLIK